jgi:hypothetical protein
MQIDDPNQYLHIYEAMMEVLERIFMENGKKSSNQSDTYGCFTDPEESFLGGLP